MAAVLNRVRRFYGAHPLNLLILLGCFALAGYAAMHTAVDRNWPWMLVWFLGAVVGHDLLLFPLYAIADRSLAALLRVAPSRQRWAPRPLVSPVNYVRTPALGSGLTFLLFLPGIIRQGPVTYHSATGLTQQPFLGRWLLLCAALFVVSAVVYAIRVGQATARVRTALRPVRSVLGPDERVLTMAFAARGTAGAVVSTHALYHQDADQPRQWRRLAWEELDDVTWLPAEKTLLVTGRAERDGGPLRVALAAPRDLPEAARARIAAVGISDTTVDPAPSPPSAGLVGWGTLAGLASGVLVGVVMGVQGMFTGLGVLGYACYVTAVGAILSAVTGHDRRGPAVTASGGVLLGALGWLAYSLTLVPLVHGHAPTWSADAAAQAYPGLVGDVLQGGLAGVLLSIAIAAGVRGRHIRARAATAPGKARVVIVGGGFAGVSAAQRFERLAVRGAPIDVTLISDSNFLLFTPMLAEAAAGAVAARHISAPVRSAVSHTRFHHGTVRTVDTDARTVRFAVGADRSETVAYDHLVLAAGSVAHTFGLPGVAEHSWTLKNLGDATRLRDHVLGLLERAEQEPDPRERRRLLTFVVVGAGFAGTEMIAELFDLVHGVSHFYPAIGPDDARFLLVHAGEAILPELSADLGDFARRRLAARGIECHVGVRVVEATADGVRLADGDWIATQTLVWTGGNRPHPLVTELARPSSSGAPVLSTDPTLRVAGLDRVWAVGDCARIPDPDNDGSPYPPTAQHATREGRAVADNIVAVLAGRPPAAFRFRTVGVLVALGHRTAVADIRGHRFSGLVAWLLWRGIYLSKLPGLEKRIRVSLDWLLDLVFARDIVVTEPRRDSDTESVPESETEVRAR